MNLVQTCIRYYSSDCGINIVHYMNIHTYTHNTGAHNGRDRISRNTNSDKSSSCRSMLLDMRE